ncbi:MAG: cyclodeaminase/cyclohydrolase family protein [Ktedonobacterales bacterium]
MPVDQDLGYFIRALGSSDPTPGGGAASAVAGALAAALAEMVAQFTAGKVAYAAATREMNSVIVQAEQLQSELLALVDEDERGFAAVTLAYSHPRTTPEEQAARTAAIQEALQVAMRAPLAVMERSCQVLALALQVAEIGNRRLASDAGCSALLGEAAVRAAGLNVLANAVLMKDKAAAGLARQQVARYIRVAALARRRVMRLVDKELGS